MQKEPHFGRGGESGARGWEEEGRVWQGGWEEEGGEGRVGQGIGGDGR